MDSGSADRADAKVKVRVTRENKHGRRFGLQSPRYRVLTHTDRTLEIGLFQHRPLRKQISLRPIERLPLPHDTPLKRLSLNPVDIGVYHYLEQASASTSAAAGPIFGCSPRRGRYKCGRRRKKASGAEIVADKPPETGEGVSGGDAHH